MSQESTSTTKRWSEEYPELGNEPIPVEPSISQEYFELERDRIFRKVWLYVGCRVEEIPNPGDYLVKEIKICNASILVVRGKDGAIRAFHNVCTHYGNKLAWNERGSLTAISCKFHGWTFNLEGRLTRVPDEDQFHDLKRNEHNLVPVATDVWEGFIFINLDPKPKETLKAYLGELWDGLSGYPFGKPSPCYEYNGEIKCNWKTCKVAFQEGYHAPFLHARSANRWISRKENLLSHLPAFKIFEPHDMMSVPANANVQPTPTGALAARLARSMTRLHTREAKDLEGRHG